MARGLDLIGPLQEPPSGFLQPEPRQVQPQIPMLPRGMGSADTSYRYPAGDEYPVDQGVPARDEYVAWMNQTPTAPGNVSVSPYQPPSSGLQLASSMGGGGSSSEPSDFNWITALGAGLQSAGAAHFGNYGVAQGYMQLKQQADLRKQMFAQQQAQAEEAKRQHNMMMTEKLIQTGNLDALTAFGKEFAPAGLIGSAMAQKDLAEVPSLLKGGYLDEDFVKSIFSEDGSKRPTPGQIKAHVDFAKEMFKEDYKAQVKNSALDKALAVPADKRTPGQARLVEDHQTELDLKKAQTEEHQAKAVKALTDEGDAKLSYGVDRVSIAKEHFGKSPKDLTSDEMAVVNQKYKELQGFLAGERSNAAQQAQVTVPDKLGSDERKAVMNDIQALGHITTLKALFKPELIGRIRGTIGGIKEWAGIIGTDESTLRSEIATMKNMVIQARSGLATSAQEAARIDKEVPDATNSPTIFLARLKLTEKNLRKLANDRRNLYKQTGLDVSGLTPISPDIEEPGTAQPAPSGGQKYKNLDEWKKANGY